MFKQMCIWRVLLKWNVNRKQTRQGNSKITLSASTSMMKEKL